MAYDSSWFHDTHEVVNHRPQLHWRATALPLGPQLAGTTGHLAACPAPNLPKYWWDWFQSSKIRCFLNVQSKIMIPMVLMGLLKYCQVNMFQSISPKKMLENPKKCWKTWPNLRFNPGAWCKLAPGYDASQLPISCPPRVTMLERLQAHTIN